MNIIIIGDVGASQSNIQAFCNADKDLFSSKIQDICLQADLVILNLEKPLTDQISPLGKCPPDYVAPTQTINGIKLLHPSVVTLANNHVMDQKEQGLRETIRILEQNNIQYVGVGKNITEARKPLIIEKNGIIIGIYACCEKEFSYATDISSGANLFDPIETFDDIYELKSKCDYVIVLFHGGLQGFPYPTPYQQKVCRKMCEKGADLVVCQHSHIIGCEERYADGTIVYGQGNFLLDDVDTESWRNGVILDLSLDGQKSNVSIIPIEVNNHKVMIHHNETLIRQMYYERSKEILDCQLMNNIYTDYCRKKLPDYLMKLSGLSSFRQKIMSKFNMKRLVLKKYNKKELLYVLDYLYCDSHREAIEKSIEKITEV